MTGLAPIPKTGRPTVRLFQSARESTKRSLAEDIKAAGGFGKLSPAALTRLESAHPDNPLIFLLRTGKELLARHEQEGKWHAPAVLEGLREMKEMIEPLMDLGRIVGKAASQRTRDHGKIEAGHAELEDRGVPLSFEDWHLPTLSAKVKQHRTAPLDLSTVQQPTKEEPPKEIQTDKPAEKTENTDGRPDTGRLTQNTELSVITGTLTTDQPDLTTKKLNMSEILRQEEA